MQMSTVETSYRRLETSDEEDEEESPTDEQAYLVHVADGSKARWHHIEDLDAFFTRVYQYHQNHGLVCIMTQRVFELIQFIFVVGLSTFLLRCVKYDVLFANKNYLNATDKTTMRDAVYLGHECSARIGLSALLVLILIMCALFWAMRAMKGLLDFIRLREIKAFYSSALRIKEHDIDNTTWCEVQQRMMLVQRDQQMCIHKQDLTELDIYNRILRFKNYMIAMVNKEVLPMRYHIPILGEVVFLTRGLKLNIEWILFKSPWSLFANNYNLKEKYKRRSNREELIKELRKQLFWVGVLNLLLCPIIFVWQVLYSFFSYAEILRREPNSFGARRWSMYSRLYLRHFNELSHEFQARLNRGYSPATKYMDSFKSPLMSVIAKNVAFFAGSIVAVLLALAVWDEDVFRVEHVLTTVTLCGIVVTICRSLIPDENAVYCPEQLMKKVLSQIHYVPGSWHGRAHTQEVRDQFSQLFQYRAVYIIEELLSPFVTPFILMFPLRARSSRIIDFFRNFTVDIAGVGDVCSFAQMDVRRHGDPKWQVTDEPHPPKPPSTKAEGGKTELSLVHFAITNPKWRPPQSEDKFLSNLKTHAHHDALMLSRHEAVQNPLLTSLQSLGSIGIPQASFLQQPAMSLMMSTVQPQYQTTPQQGSALEESVPPESLTYEESMMTSSFPRQPMAESKKSPRRLKLKGGSHQEGSMEESGLGLVSSMVAGHQGMPLNTVTQRSATLQQSMLAGMAGSRMGGAMTEQTMAELAPVEMGISALYMHELYHNRLVHEDRTANWESVGDNLNSADGYHSDDNSSETRPSSGGQYSASRGEQRQTQYTAPGPSHPLLRDANSNPQIHGGAQNYNTLHFHPHFGPHDPQNYGDRPQRPFMGPDQSHTVDMTRFVDAPPNSQGQRSTGSIMSPTDHIDLASDSDEAPLEFDLPIEPEPKNSSSIHGLPSIGIPPAYDEQQTTSFNPPKM